MIKCDKKFENLEEELVNLPEVLKNSLQKEILTIKQLNKNGEKFAYVSKNISDLTDAEYVIFSAYMNRDYHDSESFIFIDSTGRQVCTLSGRDTDLYDMIKKCDKLVETHSHEF
jgi:hypothetical protein